MHSPYEGKWLCSHRLSWGLGTHVPFMRNSSQYHPSSHEFPEKAGSLGPGLISAASICLAPGVAAPRALALAAPQRCAHGASAQFSKMLNNSCMRGVAKGCMSWMRSSRWVCWALMLRSSVSIAMIFRNRNLPASQSKGWGTAHPCPYPPSLGPLWSCTSVGVVISEHFRSTKIRLRKLHLNSLSVFFSLWTRRTEQPGGLKVWTCTPPLNLHLSLRP